MKTREAVTRVLEVVEELAPAHALHVLGAVCLVIGEYELAALALRRLGLKMGRK
jgi:hypothetical protein